MDEEAVWSASEDDLASLGLTEKADVLTLKSFVYQEIMVHHVNWQI